MSNEQNTLEDEIQKDLKIDLSDLASEAATNPLKHFKYLKLLKTEKHNCTVLEQKLKIVRRNQFMYYIGKHPTEVCSTVFDKSELKTIMEGDPKILEAEARLSIVKKKQELLEEVVRAFINRGYAIKNIIDARKLELGVI